MEKNKIYCSHKEHKDLKAIEYCQDCNIYMCNKCANHHKGYENHYHYNITKDNNDIFINICKEENHPNKLEYFCKSHNKLVCVNCIANLEGKGKGLHRNCNICFIENIKDEKRNKLAENVKILENLLLDDSINKLKELFEKISKKKDEIKINIQKIFTKLRDIINKREDELLLEVDKLYNDIFFNENIIKESEDLPNKIKKALDKLKLIENSWNDNNKIINIINDCINIEEYIKNIYLINDNIKKCNSNKDFNIMFNIKDNFIEDFTNNIKLICNLNIVDSLILKNKEETEKFYKLIYKFLNIYSIFNNDKKKIEKLIE